MGTNYTEDETNKRGYQMLAWWYQGNTLEEIGRRYGLTRERVRQIIEKRLRKEVKDKLLYYGLSEKELEEVDLASFVRLEKKTVREMEERKRVAKELERVNNSRIDPQKFYLVESYAKVLKVNKTIIEKYFPEIVELIEANEEMRKKRWSRDYLRCRQCGTTSVKHHSLGLCERCYVKSEHFKELQTNSWIKNKEKRRAKEKEYAKDYFKRPEVVERRRQQEDLRCFSGNREKAIQAANYQCSFCHISRQGSYEKYGKDLYVRHLNDKEDNNLENLMVLCQDCFQRKEWEEKGKPPSLVKQMLKGGKSMSSVINIVANYYGVKPDNIIGKRRKRKFVLPRMVAAFLMRDQLGISFPKIGRKLGGRDHTTAIYSYEKISKECNTDEKIKRDIDNIKGVLRF